MKKSMMTHVAAFAMGGAVMFFITDVLNSSDKKEFSAAKMEPKMRQFKDNRKRGLNPSDQMNLMMKSMDSMVNRGFGKLETLTMNGIKVSEIEEDNQYKVIISGEGIDKESLSFDINNGLLRVSANIVKEQKTQMGMTSFRSSFSRAFSLPQYVNQDDPEIESSGDEIIISFNMK